MNFFLAKWLEGEITDSELKNLVSDEDYIAYQKLKNGINLYGKLNQPLDDSFTNIQNKLTNKTKIRKLNLKWIASIAAMHIFFIGFYQFLGNDGVLTSTQFGEQKTVALLDGSEVILNAKSAINYSKKDWNTNREIFLNGEAFFKVKKGKTFTVNTKNGVITVLGTKFNVKSYTNYFEVVCFEGRIKVINNGKSFVLKPTEVYRKIDGNISNELNYKIKSPTWILGESTYKSIPLKYVIQDLKNQYNLNIDSKNIDDSIIFTGSFTHKNIDIALKSIFNALDIKYKKVNSKLIKLG